MSTIFIISDFVMQQKLKKIHSELSAAGVNDSAEDIRRLSILLNLDIDGPDASKEYGNCGGRNDYKDDWEIEEIDESDDSLIEQVEGGILYFGQFIPEDEEADSTPEVFDELVVSWLNHIHEVNLNDDFIEIYKNGDEEALKNIFKVWDTLPNLEKDDIDTGSYRAFITALNQLVNETVEILYMGDSFTNSDPINKIELILLPADTNTPINLSII